MLNMAYATAPVASIRRSSAAHSRVLDGTVIVSQTPRARLALRSNILGLICNRQLIQIRRHHGVERVWKFAFGLVRGESKSAEPESNGEV